MAREVVRIPNLAGGLNQGLHPTLIEDNQMVALPNFYVDGDSLAPRRGTRAQMTGQADSGRDVIAQSFLSFRKSVLDVFIFILNARYSVDVTPHVAYVDGFVSVASGNTSSDPVPIPKRWSSGTPTYPATYKLSFAQVNGIWRAASDGGRGLMRGTDTYWEDAGIPGPLTAPVLASVGTGTMTTADYGVVYTFYNPDTGDESDYSPVAVFSLTGPDSIAVTGMQTSNVSQATRTRVYVTLPGQSDAYFFATEVASSSSTATVDVTPDTVGDPVDNDNDIPPANIIALCIFDNRLVVLTADGFVRFSKYLRYETFIADDAGIPYNDGGVVPNAILPWNGKLVVGGPLGITLLTPTGTGDYTPLVLSDKYGVRSKHAMKAIEDTLIWYDGFVFRRSDSGGHPVDISGQQIKTILKDIPIGERGGLSAEIFPRQNLYVVRVPQPGDTTVVLAYNYRLGVWSTFNYDPDLSPIYFGEGFDVFGNREVYAIFDGDLTSFASNVSAFAEVLDSDSADDLGIPIDYGFTTKAFERPTVELQSIRILTGQEGATAEISVYRDLSATPFETRALYFYSPRSPWKWSPLNTRGSGATMVQVGLECVQPLSEDFRITAIELEFNTRDKQRLEVQQ